MAFASLTIDLNARIANIEADLGRVAHQAELQSKRIQASFAKIGAGLGAIGGLAAGSGLVAMIKTSIDAADQMNDLAIRTGTTVKALASYELAAKQSGTSVEALASGLNKMSVYMANNATEAKKLGLSSEDPIENFAKMAEVLAGIESPAKRNAVAMKVFGKSYEELIPLLSQGRAELDRSAAASAQYAEKMAKFAEDSDKFNDALVDIEKNTRTLTVSMAGPMVNALNEAFAAARRAEAEFGQLGGALAGLGQLGTVGQTLGVVWANTAYVFNQVGREVGGIAAQLAALASGKFREAGIIGDVMKRDAAAARQEIDALEKRILGLTGKTSQAGANTPKKKNTFDVDAFLKGSGSGKVKGADATLAILAAQQKLVEDHLRASMAAMDAGLDDRRLALTDYLLFANDTADEELTHKLAALAAERRAIQAQAGTSGDKRGKLAEVDSKEILARREHQRRLIDIAEKGGAAQLKLNQEFADANNQIFDEALGSEDYRVEQETYFAKLAGEMKAILDPIQKYRDELDKIDQLQERALLTPDEATAARFYWQEQIQNAAGFNEELERSKTFAEEFGLAFTSAFEDAIVEGKKFSDVLGSLAQDATRIFLRQSVTEPLGKWFSGLDIGKLFTSANGNAFVNGQPIQAFAAGGIVSSPTVFPLGLMGEAGPEAILPLKRGSDGKLGVSSGGSAPVYLSINISTPDVAGFKRSEGQVAAAAARLLATARRNM